VAQNSKLTLSVATWTDFFYSSLKAKGEFKDTGSVGLCGIFVNGTSPLNYIRSITCHMGSPGVTCHPTQVNASENVKLREF